MNASARRALRRLRLAGWAAALLAALYLVWRFDLARLPEGSCSPVLAVGEGDRMWLDTRPGAVGPGDVVLFRDPAGAGPDGRRVLLLGKVVEAPPSLPAAAARAVDAGALWIVADHPSCPARDSRLLGPIPADAVAARLLLAW